MKPITLPTPSITEIMPSFARHQDAIRDLRGHGKLVKSSIFLSKRLSKAYSLELCLSLSSLTTLKTLKFAKPYHETV